MAQRVECQIQVGEVQGSMLTGVAFYCWVFCFHVVKPAMVILLLLPISANLWIARLVASEHLIFQYFNIFTIFFFNLNTVEYFAEVERRVADRLDNVHTGNTCLLIKYSVNTQNNNYLFMCAIWRRGKRQDLIHLNAVRVILRDLSCL